jgi:16S rRNA (uracil1498-N3)-methyltransferase
MRANYRMQRIFVPHSLSQGIAIAADPARSHYLVNVLRLGVSAQLLLFNGRDGEWLAQITAIPKKKDVELTPLAQTRPQTAAPDLVYCFAPLKQARLDYMVQKAVEMGVGVLQPVITQHTQMSTIGTERLKANAVEAAEQCGVLSVPRVEEAVKLDRVLWEWEPGRQLIFCDEGLETNNPLPVLSSIKTRKLGLLVGPEGGFSEQERQQLRALPFVTPIPLGRRILRSDTAAVAALAVIQATLGDW